MLITLAIIGVVAALTIPSVITNYRNHETEVKLKKVYTELSQVINRSIIDNGPMDKWMIPDEIGGYQIFIDKYFTPYLKIAKNCNIGSAYMGKNGNTCSCERAFGLHGKTTWQCQYKETLILSDGTKLNWFCSAKNLCVIFADLNADKGPNIIGKDIFAFSILNKNKFTFCGVSSPNRRLTDDEGWGGYACSKKYVGYYCGALIQRNGWKIPTKEDYINKFKGKAEDYPW